MTGLFPSLEPPTDESRDILIFGFLRQINEARMGLMPDDIITIFTRYIMTQCCWIFKGDILRRFISKDNTKSGRSQFFLYDDTLFCGLWHPNGKSENDDGLVKFSLYMKSMPLQIQSMTVYIELKCVETNSHWKSVQTFTKQENFYYSWNKHNMKLSQCQNVKSLHFSCDVDKLRIEYKNGTFFNKKMDMNECSQFEWKLLNEKLAVFKDSMQRKRFYSERFGIGMNWCLFIIPNYDNQTRIRLRLLGLPNNIKCVNVLCKLSSNDMYNRFWARKFHKRFSYSENTSLSVVCAMKNDFFSKIDPKKKGITITAKIKILEVWDINDQIIPKNKWRENGILN